MVLNDDAADACANQEATDAAPQPVTWGDVRSICCTESVWTIDIYFLLVACGTRCAFLTSTLGCDPSYSDLSFYEKELSGDEIRVQRLFDAAAKDSELRVRRATVPRQVLVDLLIQGITIIALVDLRLLRPSSVAYIWPSTYMGHYVVLHGIDADCSTVHYHDPAAPAAALAVPLSVLEAARKARGTDEDLLFIDRRFRKRPT